MKGKVFKFLFVSIIIIILLMADFIILGQGIAIAIYEELEAQNSITNVKNVEFNSYFLNDNEKVHYKEIALENEGTLVLNVNVKDKGLLSDAKINIQNANFEIVKEKVTSDFVKDISTDTNEIELNEIIYQNNVEIQIPIKFKKQESFSEDYFEKENTIVLTGIYKDEEEKEVYGEIKTRIFWKTQTDINLTQKIEKYIDLGEEGILLQQNVISEVIDNKLPRQNEVLKIDVPQLDEKIPGNITVLANGRKLPEKQVIFDKENKVLQIQNESKGVWGQPNNEYKIIYKYSDEIEFTSKTIDLKTTAKTKLYTQDEIEKKLEETIEISQVGNVASIEKTVANELYKGYMYANVNNTTDFEEYNYIEISDISSIQGLEISKGEETFIDDKGNSFDISSDILYKNTIINKNDFIRIFDTTGEIVIKDQANNPIATINQNTEADKKGNIIITYGEMVNDIKILTSEPVCEGNILIKNTRAIKGQTGYTKEQLKTFSKLSTGTILNTNLSEEAKAEVTLNDTKTEAKIEINNNNLSTLQNNENVQLLVTLKSDSEKYDLFKSPDLEIVFPKGLKVNVKNIMQLSHKEELTIANPYIYTNDSGEQVISLKVEEEQSTFGNSINEGIQIAIIADIVVDKATPSKADKITMNYTNDNRKGEIFTTYADINLNSKYGVLTINKITNYNSNDDIIENINSGVKVGYLETLSESINAKQQISIINNYEQDITDVSVIVKIPEIGEEKIDDEDIKSNFRIKLKDTLEKDEIVEKIYYSTDINAENNSKSWVENVEDITTVKAFKIQLAENKLQAGNVVNLLYDIEIPGQLEENRSTYSKLTLVYNYAGDVYTENSYIVLKTEEKEINKNQILSNKEDGMKIELLQKTSQGVFEEGQDVLEGQKIRYILNLTNNSSETMKNIKVEAEHENAILWEHVEYEIFSSHTFEKKIVTKYEENPNLNKNSFTIEELKSGESAQIEYQISVKEVENENQQLTGNIKITAEGLETEDIAVTSNKIKNADLNLLLKDSFYEQTDIYTTGGLPIELQVKNITNQEMENVIVELPLPEELYFTVDEFIGNENVEFVEYKDKVVKFRINKILAGEIVSIFTQLIVEKIPIQTTECFAEISFNVELNNDIHYSNTVSRKFYQSETEIVATQTANKKTEYVENGDKITFTTNIQNKGIIPLNIYIYDDMPDGAVIKDAYILVEGNKKEVSISKEYNNISGSIEIEGNQTIQLIIETEINTKYILENSITNYVQITGRNVDIKTNEITYKIKSENPDSDGPNEEPEKPDEKVFDISGIAWVDENENGYREKNEEKLKDIDVELVDTNTGIIAKDNKGKELRVKTFEDGSYKFEGVKKGSYIVTFSYDSGKYSITEYKAQGVSENVNSDVISKSITTDNKEKNIAITGTLQVKDKDLENIDAGFIKNKRFDLRLDKFINRIIIQNNKGTTLKEYNNTQLAKIEIDSKQISNSTVIIEYKIQVTNEGELAGYVNEVVDYMPSDLSFSSELNNNWYQLTGGELYSKELSNEVINPGESKTIKLTLIKAMNHNNMGTSINTAEINKASNDFSLKDVDSIPGNKISGEDDMSTAQVIISIRTGGIVTYTLLIISMLVITIMGVYFIKKYVIEK